MRPDDSTFALLCRGYRPQVWDLGSGECAPPLEGTGGPVDSVALSADGRVALTAATDGALHIWDLDWDLALPRDS